MLDVATFFYKHLLGFEARRDIHLEPIFLNPDELITDEENLLLQNLYLKRIFKILLWSLMPMVHLVLMASPFSLNRHFGISLNWILWLKGQSCP